MIEPSWWQELGIFSVPERWEERAEQDLSAGAAALFCSPGCSGA